MKNNFLIDIPVALIFFARPDHLEVTFNKIRQLKPSILFLIQDGARTNNKFDKEKVLECKKIVENIDWECQVFKNYSETNLGCGLRVKTGISWAFEYVDRLVIIEEDCVPGDSFLFFCKEMLEKYQNDERVSMISGMNHLDKYEISPNDYFFSEGGTIWGWATWKRAWETIDFELTWLEDEDAVRLICNKYGKHIIERAKDFKNKLNQGQRLSSWSFQHGINMLLQHGLILLPKYNLVSNIGIGEGGANTGSSLELLPKSIRSLYYKKTFILNPPYKHPKYVINDVYYYNEFINILGLDKPYIKLKRKIESKYYRIIFKIKKLINV